MSKKLSINCKKLEMNGEILGYALQIKEQSHRNKEFGVGIESFTAIDKFTLRSLNHVEGYTEHNLFYVRGKDTHLDNDITVLLYSKFYKDNVERYMSRLRVAVKEYNQFFSKTQVVEVSDIEIIE